jgi:hypothetical protein
MRRLSNAVFALVCLIWLSGCGSYYKYDSTVSGEQKSLIEKDMGRIEGTEMIAQNGDDLRIIQIADLSGPSLINWLQNRNRVVVGEDYDWLGSNFITQQKVTSAPQLLTSAQVDFPSTVNAGGTVTVMVNLGAAIYLEGVKKNVVYTVTAANTELRVWSPRSAGMIQVGEGLFNLMVESSPLDSWAHSVRRFSTYLHEATHTDGNGDHRAFAHASCPSTFYRPEFRDQYACEGYLNGPYSRQVVFLKYAIPQVCAEKGCSSAEQDALLKTMADYDSRKLSSAVYADPTPEGYSVGEISEFGVMPQVSEVSW